MTHEPFGVHKAHRLVEEARAVEDEFTELTGWSLGVDEAYMLASIRGRRR